MNCYASSMVGGGQEGKKTLFYIVKHKRTRFSIQKEWGGVKVPLYTGVTTTRKCVNLT